MNATNIDPNVLLILDKVNSFYGVSWQHLLWFAGGLITVMGVLVPFLNQWYQRRSFQAEKSALSAELNTELKASSDAIEKKLTKVLQKQLSDESEKISKILKELEQGAEKVSNRSIGATLYVQAKGNLDSQQYGVATSSFLDAALLLLKGDDEYNLQKALKQLSEECFPKMTKQDIEAAHPYVDFSAVVSGLTKDLEKHNENGRYSNQITELRAAFLAAQKRERPS